MSKKISLDEILERLKIRNINNDFLYPYLQQEYKNTHCKITIQCNKCGYIFSQLLSNHLSLKQGCQKCAKNQRLSNNEIIERLKIRNLDNSFTYLNVNYKNIYSKLTIKCNKCGNIFSQSFKKHMYGQGCPVCKISQGERKIKDFLIQSNITYYQQYKFEGCKNIFQLPFDFYLPDFNICIEYDGIQHFEPREKFGGKKEFEKSINRDKIKNEYCLDNNIKIVRISYKDDIIEKLNFYLKYK